MVRVVCLVAVVAGCSFAPGAGESSQSTPDAPGTGKTDGGSGTPTPDALGIDSPPPIPITFVQGAETAAGNDTSSLTLQYHAAETAGDLNVVVVSWHNGASVTSVTDNAGNTYQRAGSTVSFNFASIDADLVTYYCPSVQGGQQPTITAKFNAQAHDAELRIAEYSGLASVGTFDAWNSNVGGGVTLGSDKVTTTNAHDLLFVADVVGGDTIFPDSSYTVRSSMNDNGDIVMDREVMQTGQYDASAGQDSLQVWAMAIYAFKGER